MLLRTFVKRIGLLQPLFSRKLKPQNLFYCRVTRFSSRRQQDSSLVLPYINIDDSRDIDSFADLEMPQNLKKKLLTVFPQPTEIQKRTAQVILDGQDLIGIAKTGSGKTIAYSLPILLKLAKDPKPTTNINQGPRYLIVCPTRELAQQIYEHVSMASYELRLKTGVVFGGVSRFDQIMDIREGVDVLIGTPGRILDFIVAKFSLNRLEYLTVDEADRIIEVGYEEQINQIAQHIPKNTSIQTTFFSATWSNKIKGLIECFLKPDAKYVQIGQSQITLNSDITQIFEITPQYDDKIDSIVYLINENPDSKFIVFCNTKTTAAKLQEDLLKLSINVCRLSGDLKQKYRSENLQIFKQGYSRILIATDVASRGLDIKAVHFVVNFESPFEVSSYIHRIGRTGRAGNKGTSITYLCNQTSAEFLKGLVNVMQQNEIEISQQLQMFADQRIEQSEARYQQKMKRRHKAKKMNRSSPLSAKNKQMLDLQSEAMKQENKRKMAEYLNSEEWKQ